MKGRPAATLSRRTLVKNGGVKAAPGMLLKGFRLC
jgi:hypothetical protein